MDVLTAVVLLLALAAPIGLINGWFVSGGVTGIARAFLPAPPMPWPHGVQEDDDFHWKWSGTPTPDAALPADTPNEGASAVVEDLPAGEGPAAAPIRRD